MRALAAVAFDGLQARMREGGSGADLSTAPRRLMHVVLNLRVGGLERVVVDLVRNTDPSRYAAEVCCLDGGGDLQAELEALGIEVTLLRMSDLGGGAVLRSLADRMRRSGTAVVHTHNVLPHKFGALAARCAGVPVVVHTKHGRNFVRRPFEHPKAQVYGHLLSWITDRIVAVSENAHEVCRRYELVPARKLMTMKNGIDVRRYELEIDRAAVLSQLGIPASARVVGNVARCVLEKDHATLVRAFARVLPSVPDAFLLLVGDGPLLEATGALCRGLGLAERVKLAGRRADVPRVLRALDVFALSSITEGTSISLLEAMSAEVPVVATAVGGNPELVEDGVTGLLCPPSDPDALAARIGEVLRSPAPARHRARAAKAKVIRLYSLDRVIAEYMQLYDDLLDRRREAPGATAANEGIVSDFRSCSAAEQSASRRAAP
jgi:glycosyltransferase involved in cell wall biosynthesis